MDIKEPVETRRRVWNRQNEENRCWNKSRMRRVVPSDPAEVQTAQLPQCLLYRELWAKFGTNLSWVRMGHGVGSTLEGDICLSYR
jgi:hypothetical protein